MSDRSPFGQLLLRHFRALWFVLTVIIPVIVRKRSRPIIFSRWSGIGDIICTIPAARKVAERHRGAPRIYNCHPDSAPLVYDSDVAEYATHCEEIGIVGHWYRPLLRGFYHFAYADEFAGQSSTASLIDEFALQCGVLVDGRHPGLRIDVDARERVRTKLAGLSSEPGPLIVIHTGPSWPIREWSDGSWQALVEGLRQHGYTNIVRLGLGHHLTFGQVALREIPGTISIVDQLSLRESIALISLANLFVGIDSGLLHIAASVGTLSVSIWGPTLPNLRFAAEPGRRFVVAPVECRGCHHRSPRIHWETNCPYDIQCMKRIQVPVVLEAALALLGDTRLRRDGE